VASGWLVISKAPDDVRQSGCIARSASANIADTGKHNSNSQKLTFVYQPSTAAAVTKRTGIAYERRLAIQLSRSVTANRNMRRVVTSQSQLTLQTSAF